MTNRYSGIDYMPKDTECQPPDPRAVSEFLTAFKLAIDYERCEFRGRPRTEQDLIDLNLTRRLALEQICRLTPSNYSAGPTPDDTDQSRDVWIFGCDLEGTEVYIKLRLNPTKPRELPRGTVWSFHKAQHPMRYPLRGASS
ncbi:MAG: hypothetical protein KF724_12295 [Phycisphaeraceae bacterium]|nr:hypothetical protein [Phycisphaeraceae bacterium]